jgi:hypothetical protein
VTKGKEVGWTVEKIGAGLGIATAIFLVGAGWMDLNNKVERLEERVLHLNLTAANDLCLAVVQRQIVAIESGVTRAQRALASLSDEYNCIRRYDILAAQDPQRATREQERESLRLQAKQRAEFEESLVEIDRALGINQDEFRWPE